MFHDLDSTLMAILDDPTAPTELRDANVSFETPDRNFTLGQPTVNLFLFEVKENRTRCDQVPHAEKVAVFVRRFPPLRVGGIRWIAILTTDSRQNLDDAFLTLAKAIDLGNADP